MDGLLVRGGMSQSNAMGVIFQTRSLALRTVQLVLMNVLLDSVRHEITYSLLPAYAQSQV